MNEFESFVDLTLGLETDEELWSFIEDLIDCGSIKAELIA